MGKGGLLGWNALRAVCLLTSFIALAGCLDDGDSSSPAAATTANATAKANSAPTLSGTAGTSIVVDSPYTFSPAASDADSDSLTFAIENKPTWATFNTLTGRLTGTPGAADIGSYSNILIRVSDGIASTALPAFSIAVTQIGIGSATLSWTPPTENVDGTPLMNLAGYYIHYGTDADTLDQTVRIDNASVNRYIIEDLSPARWYFSIKSYNSVGVESDYSGIASKVIG